MGFSHNGVDYETNSEHVNEKDLSVFYANSLEMRTSITDFMINFTQHTPYGLVENKNIMMSPSLAKQLRNALNEAIKQHEEMHGEIKDIDTLQKEFDDAVEAANDGSN